MYVISFIILSCMSPLCEQFLHGCKTIFCWPRSAHGVLVPSISMPRMWLYGSHMAKGEPGGGDESPQILLGWLHYWLTYYMKYLRMPWFTVRVHKIQNLTKFQGKILRSFEFLEGLPKNVGLATLMLYGFSILMVEPLKVILKSCTGSH